MRRDSAIGVGLLVFCGILYWQAGIVNVPPFIPIGPSFYPRVATVFLACLAVWLILEDLLRGRAAAKPGKKTAGRAPKYGTVLLAFGVFLGYVVGLSVIGFFGSTILFVLAMSWAVGPRRVSEVPKLAAISVGTAVATYLIFEKYLYVFLPRGLLF